MTHAVKKCQKCTQKSKNIGEILMLYYELISDISRWLLNGKNMDFYFLLFL
jgi:hypothetical protein